MLGQTLGEASFSVSNALDSTHGSSDFMFTGGCAGWLALSLLQYRHESARVVFVHPKSNTFPLPAFSIRRRLESRMPDCSVEDFRRRM